MRIRLFFFICCLPALCRAQTMHVEKAERYFNRAVRSYCRHDPATAYCWMERAIRCDTAWDLPYATLGRWKFEQEQFADAEKWFAKGAANCRRGGPRFAKALAKSLIRSAQPARALSIVNTYAPPGLSGEWRALQLQALFMQEAVQNRSGDMPVAFGPEINSPYSELFPCVTTDTGTFYFTRRVNNMDEDLFRATLDDSCTGWKTVAPLDYPINTIEHEAGQFISADGHYLFFGRSDVRSENGWANGGNDLFMSYRIRNDTDWTQPMPFGATINTPYYEGMPSLSPDNRELFFVSDRPGGFGGLDIWISRFEEGAWQPPVNAGPGVNTAGNEAAPYIDADNRTLYFSSDGRPGMGGYDLFVSRKLNDTLWGDARNLGFPINTTCNELSACVSKNGKKLYFGSDRGGPAEHYDIYTTTLPPQFSPIPVNYVQGYVYDSLTQDRLNYAQIYICRAATGDTLFHFQSNRGDASFMMTLPCNTRYIRHTARIGYTDVDDTFATDTVSYLAPIVKNVAMLPYDYKEFKPITDSLVATIHFDVNRVELSDGEKQAISLGISPWLEEKGVAFYVNAYTDNTGTPLINEELSFKRARLVTEYLLKLGIDEVMVFPKGWGEAKMIATNETEEGRKTNRRVEIVIRR